MLKGPETGGERNWNELPTCHWDFPLNRVSKSLLPRLLYAAHFIRTDGWDCQGWRLPLSWLQTLQFGKQSASEVIRIGTWFLGMMTGKYPNLKYFPQSLKPPSEAHHLELGGGFAWLYTCSFYDLESCLFSNLSDQVLLLLYGFASCHSLRKPFRILLTALSQLYLYISVQNE